MTVHRLIFFCFFLSGAAGLIYEVVWARQLSLFLGITSFAHTAVITAYMAGLAAGSLYFGRKADLRTNPLLIYVYLEVGVGLYALATPWLFGWLQSGYASLAGVAGVSGMPSHLMRFSIALVFLLVPTFLMGGTLPLLVRGCLHSMPALGKTTSRLYGLNTLGAMTGTLLAGYWLLPVYGIRLSIFTGVVLNLGVALVVLVILRFSATSLWKAPPHQAGGAPADEGSAKLSPAQRLAILIAFGLAGFASLLTQLAWIRALILVVGGSVYAFTITLASFLAGIGLGSLAYSKFIADRLAEDKAGITDRRIRWVAAIAVLTSFSLLVSLSMIGKLPGWFLSGYSGGLHVNFAVFQLFILTLCFAVMIVPTLFMGAMFPLITVIWTRNAAQAGRGVGDAYAINTAGTILGSLLGGLLILPWLGVHRTLIATAFLYLLVAVIFGLSGRWVEKRVNGILAVASSVTVFVFAAWLVPAWDRALMMSGVYMYADRLINNTEDRSLAEISKEDRILFYEEGLDGTVSVATTGEYKYLRINGKIDASSGGDLPTQILLAQLPALIHPDPEQALIIGLGSGITAGSLATHRQLQDITVLEISGEVVTASDFFAEDNGHVLSDPRVNLVTADARNYLLATDREFDIIVSEPSNPWISGISNLFTQEFFSLAAEHLAEDGILAQWFHTYGMSEEDLKTTLRTFRSRFPHVSIWYPLIGDLVLIGSMEPHSLDLSRLTEVLANQEAVRSDLERVSSDQIRGILRRFIFADEALDRFAEGSILNTDEHPIIEFSSPKNLYRDTSQSNVDSMVRHLEMIPQPVPMKNLVLQSENGLELPATSAFVEGGRELQITNPRGHWLINHVYSGLEDGKTAILTNGYRETTWEEPGRSHILVSTWFLDMPEPSETQKFVRSMITSEVRVGGEIVMRGGYEARWLLGVFPDTGRAEISLAWYCPAAGGGLTRYAARVNLADPGEPGWGDALVAFAGRFYTCEAQPGTL